MAALTPAALLLAMAALPLAVAALLVWTLTRLPALRLAPWAPLPALVLALAPLRELATDLPWLLLGMRLGLDATGRAFLLLSALIWLLAGLFLGPWWGERPGRLRYTGFFLVAQAGNLGLCLALDAAGFYLFFSLMTIGAYGLVAHDGSARARRAGRVYLSFALLGEMLLLAGLLLQVHAAGTHLLPELRTSAAGHPGLPPAALLIFLGFGAKTGLPLLHVALPVSYAATPAPGAAVLAGAMIKAGVLGWMRFLPLGDAALPVLGEATLWSGLAMAGAGVAAGLCQRQPGALLAYSSISQMGALAWAVGAALLAPALAPALLAAMTLYALHHAFAKAALFLGLGAAQRMGARPRVMVGLALPALALAGAPLSSGALAKAQLKTALVSLPAPWGEVLPGLLSLAALGTALLMMRLLWLVHRLPRTGQTPTLRLQAGQAWVVSLAAGLLIPAAWAPASALHQVAQAGALRDAIWPLAGAVPIFWAVRGLGWRAPPLPPGDLLLPAERLASALRRRLRRSSVALLPPAPHPPWRRSLWHRLEAALRMWPSIGLAWLLLLALLFLLLR